MKIFHNPRCKKSREGLSYLQEKTKDFTVINYLKEGLTADDIKEILLKLNVKPVELVRTREAYYKSDLKGKEFTDEEWITILSENPKLLQRPIIVAKHKAVLAQPPEEADKLF